MSFLFPLWITIMAFMLIDLLMPVAPGPKDFPRTAKARKRLFRAAWGLTFLVWMVWGAWYA